MAGQLLHIAASKLFRNQFEPFIMNQTFKEEKNIVINTRGCLGIENRDVCFHDVNIRAEFQNFRQQYPTLKSINELIQIIHINFYVLSWIHPPCLYISLVDVTS